MIYEAIIQNSLQLGQSTKVNCFGRSSCHRTNNMKTLNSPQYAKQTSTEHCNLVTLTTELVYTRQTRHKSEKNCCSEMLENLSQWTGLTQSHLCTWQQKQLRMDTWTDSRPSATQQIIPLTLGSSINNTALMDIPSGQTQPGHPSEYRRQLWSELGENGNLWLTTGLVTRTVGKLTSLAVVVWDQGLTTRPFVLRLASVLVFQLWAWS